MKRYRSPPSAERNALPNHEARCQHLYVMEFRNGLIKIGRARNPRERASANERAFRSRLVRGQAFPMPYDDFRLRIAERTALATARRIGVQSKLSTELFACLQYGEALNAVRQAAA